MFPSLAYKKVILHNKRRAFQYYSSSYHEAKKIFAESSRFRLRSIASIIKDIFILLYLLLVRAQFVSTGRQLNHDKLDQLIKQKCENSRVFCHEFSGIHVAVNLAVQGRSSIPLVCLSVLYGILCKSSLSIVHVHSDITQVGSFLVCLGNAYGITTVTGPHGCGAPSLEILAEQDGQYANYLCTLFTSAHDHLPIINSRYPIVSKILYAAPKARRSKKNVTLSQLCIVGNGWNVWNTDYYQDQLELYLELAKTIASQQVPIIYYRPHPVERYSSNLRYLTEKFHDSPIEIDTLSLYDHEVHDPRVYLGCNSTFLFQMRLAGHTTIEIISEHLFYTFSYKSDYVFPAGTTASRISSELMKLLHY